MTAIVTNTSANTVFKNYSRNQAALASSTEKLASGLKINRAGDDAAGLAVSESLRGNIKGTDKALDVTANATNFINTADGFLQTANDILGRMEELAVQAGDATLSTTDKTNIKTEYDALSGQIGSINTGAKFNGNAIFSATAQKFTVDAEGTQFSVTTGTLTAPAVMTAGSDGTAELTAVKAQIQAVTTQRAALGASQSQLNFVSSAQQNYSENVSAAESRIRNVDVAKESTNFTRSQILVQSATSMLAQANSGAQGVLKLLQ